MRYHILLTPSAKADLIAISQNLTLYQLPTESITKILTEFLEKLDSLSVFPERYPIIDKESTYHKMTYQKYLIIYSITDDTVQIKYIRPTKTNILEILRKGR